jgi:hypothetical protein
VRDTLNPRKYMKKKIKHRIAPEKIKKAFPLRLSEDDRKALRDNASGANMTPTDYIRNRCCGVKVKKTAGEDRANLVTFALEVSHLVALNRDKMTPELNKIFSDFAKNVLSIINGRNS